MQVGVGLPGGVPGTAGDILIEWSRRADQGPFSSLGTLDRLLYGNYEPMISLAAAAAVTRRVRIASTIVIGPLRSPALLAKQAASIHSLSGGRLVLGLGLGAREDDYMAVGVEYRDRGRLLGAQLAEMRNWWEDPRLGPIDGRPLLLVGGASGQAMTRMARYGDGYVHGGGPPRAFARAATEARAAWNDLGRRGAPALWGMGYFALGEDASGEAYLRDYYAFTGPFAERIAAGLLRTPDEIRAFIQGYADAGCDELILFPTVAKLDQLDRLADVLSGA